jgi:hypothetical protein
MITKTQVEQFNKLEMEKVELQTELSRINGFLNREPTNDDTERAINKNKIFVKFAGTACMLPVGIFTAELTKRKKEIGDRLVAIETELINL